MGRIDPFLISARSVVPSLGVEREADNQAPVHRGDVPRGAYAAWSEHDARARSASGASWIDAHQRGEPPGTRLRRRLRELLADKSDEIPPEDLLALQAIALQAISALFTNQFKDDGALLEIAGKKLEFYRHHHPGEEIARSVLHDRNIETIQLDMLNVVLRTFHGSDADDVALRAAVMEKLAKIGRRQDVAALLPHVRRATTPGDMFSAQECIRAITRRTGPPIERRNLHDDPEIGPLLRKNELTTEERARVIEEVLKRGAIDYLEPFHAEQYHGAEVYIVHFKEKLPGEAETIRAAFKPELTWFEKKECWYSREVLLYTFDRTFTRSGLINPTVEAAIPLREPGCEVGSLSFWEPRSEPLGRRPPDNAWDGTVPANHVPEKFYHLWNEPWFLRRLAQIKTLAYVFNNDDLIANNANPRDNFANILVVVDQKGNWDLRVIDWAPAAGGNRNAGGGHTFIDEEFLPERAVPELEDTFQRTRKHTVAELGEAFVKPPDAQFIAERMRKTEQYWKGRRP